MVKFRCATLGWSSLAICQLSSQDFTKLQFQGLSGSLDVKDTERERERDIKRGRERARARERETEREREKKYTHTHTH